MSLVLAENVYVSLSPAKSMEPEMVSPKVIGKEDCAAEKGEGTGEGEGESSVVIVALNSSVRFDEEVLFAELSAVMQGVMPLAIISNTIEIADIFKAILSLMFSLSFKMPLVTFELTLYKFFGCLVKI